MEATFCHFEIMDSDVPGIEMRKMGSTGEKVSSIGLGTYGISNYKAAEEAFYYAIDRGVSLIDTAEIYNTEDFVGNVIKKVGRENLFITTKVAPKNLTSKESTLRSAKGSLKKLGIGAVDLILIHWPHDTMSISDQVKNIESVRKEGLTRYIGVSNFSVEQMEEARSSTSTSEIVCNQVEYNMTKRDVEKDVIPYCEVNGMSVVAYTPIEKGSPQKYKGMKDVSSSTGKTPIQISLNFLMRNSAVIPIPKSENLDHIKEILGSTGWRLKDKEIALLD